MLSPVRMRLSFARLHLLSLLLIINGVVTSFSQSCDEADLRGCMEELKKLTNKQDLAFAQSEAELTKTCKHLQETMGCVNNFTNRCFDSRQREVYMTLTAGAQGLLSDLCIPGSSFREEYLKHASCFKSLTYEYRICSDNFVVDQELIKRAEMTKEEKVKRLCCLFDGYRQCTRAAVLSRCSVEAANTGEKIVTRASGPLVESSCANFKYSSPECSGTVSLITIPYFIYLITVLIVVLSQ